jgi:hypothetical protein
MEYGHVQKWRYGMRHRMKEKRKKGTKRENLPEYEIKNDIFR